MSHDYDRRQAVKGQPPPRKNEWGPDSKKHPFGDDVDNYIKFVREHLESAERAMGQGHAGNAKTQLEQAIEWAKAAIRALPKR
jgi:hypothetical protein